LYITVCNDVIERKTQGTEQMIYSQGDILFHLHITIE